MAQDDLIRLEKNPSARLLAVSSDSGSRSRTDESVWTGGWPMDNRDDLETTDEDTQTLREAEEHERRRPKK